MCVYARVCALTHFSHSDSLRPCQDSLCMGFFRQEYWNVLPFPPPGDLPYPGIKTSSPVLAGGFFTTEPPGEPMYIYTHTHTHTHSPRLRMIQPTIFQLLWYKSNTHSLETIIQIMIFSQLVCHMTLSSNAAAEGTSVPIEPGAHKGKQVIHLKIYPYNCTVFHFQYTLQ